MLRSVSMIPFLALCMSFSAKADVNILFLGDNGHHRPAERFAQLHPVLAKRGIKIDYTDQVADLNPANLAKYDGLIVYANIGEISGEQEQALLDFVAGGKGFVPLHCASYCFLNSPKYIELVGAQFKRHGTGVFRTVIAAPENPLVQGFQGFESWDETYVHDKHNPTNRTVIEYRVDEDGREPWTWIRTQGKGRVFYTAWGHDQRTWSNPGFHNLVERGIRWAVGGDPSLAGAFSDRTSFPVPKTKSKRTDVLPFEYSKSSEVPFYPPGKSWGTLEKGEYDMQLPLAPDESLKHIVTPVGFQVELFASEPDIMKPVCMAWDERGRCWVGETIDYPNQLQPPGQGRDRLKICEDTDGDGKADKFTVFADGLSIPTSIAFWKGGVIVQDGSQTLYLKDTDGDDKADQRNLLFSGWNMRDTHGGVSNFQYGLDNWIWAMQGYNNSQPTVKGKPIASPFRMGFFRFRPDGSQLEFVRSTNNNTWGLGISEEGIVFGSTANHNPSVYMPIPNRYYERVKGWSSSGLGTIADTHLFKPITNKIRQVDQHGGYTAGAGHALYTARQFPKEYWNRAAFVCGPTGKLVGTFVLNRDGADFHSTSPFNLFASDDEWTAPIMAEVGPDGCVWVLDWYNYIIQHNPTPAGFKTGKGNAYETGLRDKRHGRIYRVSYVGDDEVKGSSSPMSLAGATPQQLIEALRHPTMLWRKHAQRLLVERGKRDIVPDLIQLASDASTDEIGLNVGVIHALWTLHGLAGPQGSEQLAVAAKCLSHESAGVRRNAVLVLPRHPASTDAIVASRLLVDPDPQVRLAALLALSELPPAAGIFGELVAFMNRPENFNDAWLGDAFVSATANFDWSYLKQVAESSPEQEHSSKQLEAVTIVAEHAARDFTGQTEENVVDHLLAALVLADARTASAVVAGLAKGWREGQKPMLTEKSEADLMTVLNKLPVGGKGQLVRLATQWGSQGFGKYSAEIAASLLKTVSDEAQPDKARIAAAEELIRFLPSDDQVVTSLLAAVSPRTAPAVARGFIETLADSQSDLVGPALVNQLGSMTPAVRLAALRVLLDRPRSTRALLTGAEQGRLSLVELTLEQKQRLAAHPDRGIRARAEKLLAQGGGLPNPDRQKVLEQLMPLAQESGDASLGKVVFTKQCSKCHMHSGEGSKIGPDLTGMAVHPKEELLKHLIDPSSSVEGNYRLYNVVTLEGRILSGLLASESKTAIELFDVEGKKNVVLREDIDQLIGSPKSLMPDGFEKQVSETEIVNLLEFLTQRGKFLPIMLDKYATIVSTKGMFINEESTVERLVFADWSPKVFEGVPFVLVDPQGDRVPNVIMLNGPKGKFPPTMPKTVTLPCNAPASAIHLLSAVSGWGAKQAGRRGISMIVRLHYADGKSEDHPLYDGQHFADYIGVFNVPDSKLAFKLRDQQIRYLAIRPNRPEPIQDIELIKGSDRTAPIVMAVTVEGI